MTLFMFVCVVLIRLLDILIFMQTNSSVLCFDFASVIH